MIRLPSHVPGPAPGIVEIVGGELDGLLVTAEAMELFERWAGIANAAIRAAEFCEDWREVE